MAPGRRISRRADSRRSCLAVNASSGKAAGRVVHWAVSSSEATVDARFCGSGRQWEARLALSVGDGVERGEPGEGRPAPGPGRDGGEAVWSGQRTVGQGDLVMAAMVMDDSSSAWVALAEGGWLWQMGRLVWATASSVMVDSMSQPLRDRVELAWNPWRRVSR